MSKTLKRPFVVQNFIISQKRDAFKKKSLSENFHEFPFFAHFQSSKLAKIGLPFDFESSFDVIAVGQYVNHRSLFVCLFFSNQTFYQFFIIGVVWMKLQAPWGLNSSLKEMKE